eukprot:175864-Hanusia_phi.AAC.1
MSPAGVALLSSHLPTSRACPACPSALLFFSPASHILAQEGYLDPSSSPRQALIVHRLLQQTEIDSSTTRASPPGPLLLLLVLLLLLLTDPSSRRQP